MKKIFIFIALSLVPLIFVACGPYGHMGGWQGGGNYWCGSGFGYGGMYMWVVFLIVLIVALYFIIKAIKSKNVMTQIQETPVDIFKMRYAKGEITKDEFDRMKKNLSE